jgi:hypothetical protein
MKYVARLDLSGRHERQIRGVQTLIQLNTCHILMISEPERLANILIERCRLHDT